MGIDALEIQINTPSTVYLLSPPPPHRKQSEESGEAKSLTSVVLENLKGKMLLPGKISVSVLNEISEDLKLECPVCFDTLFPPIYLTCIHGHLVCDRCLTELTTCPMCREELPKTRIIAVEVEDMIRQFRKPCPFSKTGCDALLEYNGFEIHQLDCSFANLDFCSNIGFDCGEKLTREDLPQHLVLNHGVAGSAYYHFGGELRITQDYLQPLPRRLFNDGQQQQQQQRILLIHTSKPTFFLKAILDTREQIVSWTLFAFGNTAMANRYSVSMKLFSVCHPSASLMSKTISLEWMGPVCSVQPMGDTPNWNSFCVPYMYMPALYSLPEETLTASWEMVLKIQTH